MKVSILYFGGHADVYDNAKDESYDNDNDDDVQEKSKHQSPWCINTQMQLVLCEHYFEAN